MKRILAFIICVLILCAVPFVASAEENVEGEVVTDELPEGENTPETETPTEGENSGDEDYEIGDVYEGEVPGDETPEETPPVEDETPEEIPEDTPPEAEPPIEVTPEDDTTGDSITDDIKSEAEVITAKIAKWLETNSLDITKLITYIAYGLVLVDKLRKVLKSMGTINNNSIAVSQKGDESMQKAAEALNNVNASLGDFKVALTDLMDKYEKTNEANAKLEARLEAMDVHLENSKRANVELSNEVAELLVLANIPNSKKDELYARHRAAVALIAEADKTEVTEDEGNEV